MTPPIRQLRTRKAKIRAVLIVTAAVFALVNVGSGLLRGQEEAPRQGASDAEIEEYLTDRSAMPATRGRRSRSFATAG